MGQRAQIVGIAEVDEFVVDELVIGNLPTLDNCECAPAIIGLQPLLPIICALLGKRQTDCVIGSVVPLVFHVKEVLEPLPRLLGGRRAQSLVIFHRGSLGGLITAVGLAPCLEFPLGIEGLYDTTLRHLEQWSSQTAEESLLKE